MSDYDYSVFTQEVDIAMERAAVYKKELLAWNEAREALNDEATTKAIAKRQEEINE